MFAPFEWHRALTLDERQATGEHAAAPPWLSEFRRCYGAAAADVAPAVASDELALVDALWPITTPAVAQVAEATRRIGAQHSVAIFDGEALEAQARQALHARLFVAASRALVVELAAAQATGLLQGDTPAARFAFFVECLREPAFAESLLARYPVLVRQAVTMTLDWRDSVIEFLERFGRDRAALLDELLDGRDPGALAAATFAAGDSHRGGRSVIVAAFADGRKLVYKPRSLAADRHFGELIDWINARAPRLGLRTATVVDRGAYGWSAFVTAHACASEGEVATFCRRQGANLALLQLVGGADLHSENVIAAGDTPYLVDLEALFHPVLLPATERGARRVALRALAQSVLRTGLLPLRNGDAGADDGDALDVSGMGNAQERSIPLAVPMWQDANSDEMRIVYGRQTLAPDLNLPHCDGQRFAPDGFAREIADGYAAAYKVLHAHRHELARADGPLQRFRGDPIRIIVRATVRYSMALLESFHPDCLADAIDKDRFFDALANEAADDPLLARLARAERRDLWRGDVPVFTTRTDSTAVWTSDGERLDGALPASGLDAALARLAEMGERDLARQVDLIHGALASADRHDHTAPRWAPLGVASIADPVGLAVEIGDWLSDSAWHDGDRATWMVLRETASGHAAHVPAGPDLYSGLAGIALFLASLAKVARAPRFAELAGTALRELIDDPVLRAPERSLLGAFDGLAGVVYALAHAGRLLAEPSWAAEAERLAAVLEARLGDLAELDVVSGHAGIVPAMLTAEHLTGRATFGRLARKAGRTLLGRMREACTGYDHGRLAPASFGHGGAGIAFALLRLAQTSGEAAYRDGALALRGETSGSRDLFSDATDKIAGPAGWCRGAPGVALMHAATAASGVTVPAHARADRLARAIARQVEHADALAPDCLCHGTLGNLWILHDLQGSHRGGRDGTVERLALRSVRKIAHDGARCGTHGGLKTPGLMDGLAGIGLALLRLSDRASVPNVLELGP